MESCKSCHAGCCRNYTVSLTGYDILNISKVLGVPEASFVDTVLVEAGADFEHKSKHAAVFDFSDKEGSYVFALKMVESILVPSTTKCQFLLEWNTNNEAPSMDGIIARCGIYSSRPLLCAAFPTRFSDDELDGVMLDVSKFGQNSAHPIYTTCPKAPSQEDIASSDEIMKMLVLKKYEVEYFKKVAAQWNKNPRTLGEFWEFLKESYSRRVVIE